MKQRSLFPLVVSLILISLSCDNTTVYKPILVPSTFTDSAVVLSANTAILCGSVHPNGTSTKYYFEYGTTDSYETKLGEHDGGNTTSVLHVSDTVNTLRAGTLYHYRLVAFSDGGVAKGLDKTFVTINPMVYPQTVGTTWTYTHTFGSGPRLGPGVITYVNGTWKWQVVSSSVRGDTTSCIVMVTRQDSVQLGHYVGGSTYVLDSTYATSSTTQFPIESSSTAIRANWTGLVFGDIPPNISTTIIGTSDTIRVDGVYGYALYVNRVGLTLCSSYFSHGTSNPSYISETLRLESASIK